MLEGQLVGVGHDRGQTAVHDLFGDALDQRVWMGAEHERVVEAALRAVSVRVQAAAARGQHRAAPAGLAGAPGKVVFSESACSKLPSVLTAARSPRRSEIFSSRSAYGARGRWRAVKASCTAMGRSPHPPCTAVGRASTGGIGPLALGHDQTLRLRSVYGELTESCLWVGTNC